MALPIHLSFFAFFSDFLGTFLPSVLKKWPKNSAVFMFSLLVEELILLHIEHWAVSFLLRLENLHLLMSIVAERCLPQRQQKVVYFWKLR